MRLIFILATPLLIYSATIYRDAPVEQVPDPWFTGPLLAYPAQTVPPGHYDIEPYIYAQKYEGAYQNNWDVKKSPKKLWNYVCQPLLEFGLTPWMDIAFEPAVSYNYNHGAARWVLQDSPIALNFQLYRKVPQINTDWATAVRLSFQEVFPIGKYQKLRPEKRGADIGGFGSWQTMMILSWGNLFYLGKCHFLRTIFQLSYTIATPVHVRGFNTFGGGYGTHGTMHLRQRLGWDVAFELSFTQNWVFAMDIAGDCSLGRRKFKGTNPPGNAPMSRAQDARFSLAPALEYNWSRNWGVIGGVWFTYAGRNLPEFISGVLALNYYH